MTLFWWLVGYVASGVTGYNVAHILILRKEIKELDRQLAEQKQRNG